MMPDNVFVSVITPVYNRLDNIKKLYWSLAAQTAPIDEWVIADDGSTDGLADWVRTVETIFPIKYVRLGDHTGYRQGAARNLAVSHASEEAAAFWFVDSDVLQYPNNLRLYKEAYLKNPNRVICGEYDWGAPIEITEEDVKDRFQAIIEESLPAIPNAAPHGMLGRDIRAKEFEGTTPDELHWEMNYALSTFGGNIFVPRHVFYEEWKTDRKSYKLPILHNGATIGEFDTAKPVVGFDDRFTVGIEDGDFGLMTVAKGYPISLHNGVKGYHMWHPRNIAEIQRISTEQIPLLDYKHGIKVIEETEINHRQNYQIK